MTVVQRQWRRRQGAALAAALVALGIVAPEAGSVQHSYFDGLVARADHWKSYSLRDSAQLERENDGGYARCNVCPLEITYDAVMDAAKIVVPEGRNALKNQLHLPMGTEDGHRYFVSWDVYWTSDFLWGNLGFSTYKAFQFDSNSAIWLETQMRFNGGKPTASGFDPAIHIARVQARTYNKPGGPEVWSPSCWDCLPPSTTSQNSIEPIHGTFLVWPHRWTRYFWLIEQRANDYDYVSLWVADEQQAAVRIYDRIGVNVRNGNAIDYFRIEFDTSEIDVRPNRGPLVAYARNFVILRDVADVMPLLQRPASSGGVAPRPPTNVQLVPKGD